MDLWYKREELLLLDSIECCCLCLLFWNLYVLLLCDLGRCSGSFGTGGLISMVWNSFFQGPVSFTFLFSCAVWGWTFPVVDYVSFLSIWNHVSFGWMSKDLMVLVPLKKTVILCFARLCLYCLLRPLMYSMTTLAPSISYSVHGFGFLLVFHWGLPCWMNCAG